MSSAAEHPQTAAPKFLDFDEFIRFQLEKTRGGIRTADLLSAIVIVATAVLGYLLAFVVFDQWVVPGGFSLLARCVLLTALLAFVIGWTAWKVVIPARRRVNALFAAQKLEQSQPELRNNLLTFVDLQRAGRPVAPQILSAMGKRAARSLSQTDTDAAVDRTTLLRSSWVLLGLMALLFAYMVFSPKNISASLWRALLPTADVAVATRTRIETVDPGDTEILRGSQLEVLVDLTGEVPQEIRLRFTTRDQRFVDEPVAMRPVDDRLHRFRCVLTGERGRGLLQDFHYRIEAGDARSRDFQVTVIQPPSATVDEVSYRFPQYMGLPNRTDTGGAIDAWEGTEVSIRATANLPVKSAKLVFADEENLDSPAAEAPIPLTIAEGTRITGVVPLRLREDGSVPQFYRIEVRNERGDTDPQPVFYPVRIREDLKPQIEIVYPDETVQLPRNAVVPLAYRARDPDFLLASVTLQYRNLNEAQPRPFPLDSGGIAVPSVDGTFRLLISTLNPPPQPGDRIEYWLEARDNFTPYRGRLPNIGTSAHQYFEIVDAATNEKVQEAYEDQLQTAAERLEEVRSDDQSADGGAEEEAPSANGESGAEDAAGDDSGTELSDPSAMEPGDSADEGASATPAAGTSGDSGGEATSSGTMGEGGTDESAMSESNPGGNRADDVADPMMSDEGDSSTGTAGANAGESGSEGEASSGGQTGGGGQSGPDAGSSVTNSAGGGEPSGGDAAGAESSSGTSRNSGTGNRSRPGRADSSSGSSTGNNAGSSRGQSGGDRASDDRILNELLRGKPKPSSSQGSGGDSRERSDNGAGSASGGENASAGNSPQREGSTSGGGTRTPGDQRGSGQPGDGNGVGENSSDATGAESDGSSSPESSGARPANSGRPGNGGNSASPDSRTGTTSPMTDDAMGGTESSTGENGARGNSMDGGNSPPSASGRTGEGGSNTSNGMAGEETPASDATGESPGEATASGSAASGNPRPAPGVGDAAETGMSDPGSMTDSQSMSESGGGEPAQGADASSADARVPNARPSPADSGATGRPAAGAADDESPDDRSGGEGMSETGDPATGSNRPMEGASPNGMRPSGTNATNPEGAAGESSNANPMPREGTASDENSPPTPTGRTMTPEGSGGGGSTAGQSAGAGAPSGDSAEGGGSAGAGTESGATGRPSRNRPESGQAARNSAEGSSSASSAGGESAAGGNTAGGSESGAAGAGDMGASSSEGEASVGSSEGAGQEPGTGDMAGGESGAGGAGAESSSGGQSQGGQNSGAGEGGASGSPSGSGGAAGGSAGTGGTQPARDGSSSSGGSGREAGSAGSRNQGGGTSTGQFSEGEGSQYIADDEADLEDRRRAASLALRELQDQLERGEVDEEFKARLGVTDEDLREFARRLEERLAETGVTESPEDRDRRLQLEEMLRGIEFDSAGTRRDGGAGDRNAAQGSSGVRREAPAEYRELERAYRERVSGQRR